MPTLTKLKTPKRETANALEFTTGDKPLRVDREKGVIYGVKIIGNESRNNRTYPQAVLSKAKQEYERRSVNISHPAKENAAGDRPLESFFGRLENVTEDDGLRGDLHYLKTHPLAEVICEAAERMPENFGLSHNAHVDWLVKDDGHRVCESINQVRSVDLVCRPATTNGIFESEQSMDGDENLQPAGGNGAPAAEAASAVETEDDPHCKMLLEGVKKIYDGEGDAGDKVKRIAALAKAVLKTQDDVDQAINGGRDQDDDEDEDEDDDDAEESVKEKRRQAKSELADAKARLAGFERREKAIDALEAAKVEPTKARIKAVAALESEEDRKALIEEFKGLSSKPADKPKPKSVPATALESDQRKPGDPLPTGLKPRTKDELKNLASSLQRR